MNYKVKRKSERCPKPDKRSEFPIVIKIFSSRAFNLRTLRRFFVRYFFFAIFAER